MSVKKRKIAIVGTNGIPANYGGFETLAEYLTKFLSNEFDFTVYCSKNQNKIYKTYNRSNLKHINIKANGWQSIFYDIFTLFDAAIYSDVILYLGPGAGLTIPIIRLFGKKIIVNHGGLNEWERDKYSTFERHFIKLGHKYGAKFANINITDNYILRDSIKKTFNVDSIVIRYGGDHAITPKFDKELSNKYPFLNNQSYYISVSRAQIDNNLHIVLEAFSRQPEYSLVMVSNWNVSKYGQNLKKKYINQYSNILLLDAIYDINEINALRGNAKAYIHSHSCCGTSPSLVEAMCLGLPIISFDVPTNRETTKNCALFFNNSNELEDLVKNSSDDKLTEIGKLLKEIASNEYVWSKISSQYAKLFY